MAADWSLRPVRWQQLPDGVHRVWAGPDQRAWLEMDSGGQPPDTLDQTKAQIAAAFASPSPRLQGVSLALFEGAGGRVWFRGHGHLQDVLFGYDGRTWIQRAAQAEHRYVGSPLNHGAYMGRPPHNLFVDGAAFFPDGQGVDVFDGHAWSYEKLFTGGGVIGGAYPILRVEPDGRGVVAVIPPEQRVHQPGGSSQLVVRRWRAGRWTSAADLKVDQPIDELAVAADGLWLLLRDGMLRFHPFDPARVPSFEDDLARLNDADQAVRTEAGERLIATGKWAQPLIEAALAEAREPERIVRLQTVLAALHETRPKKPRPSFFGPYRLEKVRALVALSTRTAVVEADGIRGEGQDIARGLVVLDPDGRYRAVPLADPAPQLGEPAARAVTGLPLATARGEIWTVPYGTEQPAARRIDLTDGSVTAVVPDGGYRHLFAVLDDGTLFVGASRAIAAFRPALPDERRAIKAEATLVTVPGPVVASDGAVWAHRPGEGLVRFDGRAWTPLGLMKDVRGVSWMIPGAGGRVFVAAGQDHVLVGADGNVVAAGKDATELIAANRDSFAAAFPPGWSPTPGDPDYGSAASIVADAAGNLWFRREYRLSILAGDRWIDPTLAMSAAGSTSHTARFVCPVGDNTKVFVTDFSRFAALGDVRGDQVVLLPVAPPDTPDRHAWGRALRDPNGGGLWGSVHPGNPEGPHAGVRGQFTCRMTTTGIDRWFPHGAGRPILVDRDGNVWLDRDVLRRRTRGLAVWRDGQVGPPHALAFPGAGDHAALLAVAPGSVLAWTEAGIHHYTAADGRDPSSWRLARTHAVDGVGHPVQRVAFSSLGYAVVTCHPARPAPTADRQAVYLVPLP